MSGSPKVLQAFAWVMFAAGFVAAVLFCLWPFSVFAHACLFCFGFDFDATRGVVVSFAAAFAVMNGSLYGLVGIAIGHIVSRTKAKSDRKSGKHA